VPYGPANANQNLALLVEEGFKQVRGSLTEGRYLTFEMLGMALTNVGGGFVSVSFATPQHDNIHQRWILHAQGSENTNTNTFTIQSAVDQQYISKSLLGRLVSKPADAQPFTIVYNPNGATYSLQLGSGGSGRHVSLQQSGGGSKRNGPGSIQWGDATLGSFEIFSVSYHH
jgi:phospholipase C